MRPAGFSAVLTERFYMTDEKNDSVDSGEEKKPAPKKRVRRVAAKKPASEPVETGAAEPQDSPAAKKPRRRAASSSRAVAADSGDKVSEASDEAVAVTSKPKRTTTRTRKPKSASASEAAEPAISPKSASVDMAKSEEDVKVKAPANSDPAGESAGPAVDGSVAAPKRRPGRPRKPRAAVVVEPVSDEVSSKAVKKNDIKELNQVAQEATRASSVPGEPPMMTVAPAKNHEDASTQKQTEASAEQAVAGPSEKSEDKAADKEPDGDSPRRARRTRRKLDRDLDRGEKPESREADNKASDAIQQNGAGGKKRERYSDHGGDGQGSGRNGRRNNRKNRGRDFNSEPSLTMEELAEMKVADLRAKAAELEVEYVGLRKAELVEAIYAAAARAEGFRPVDGILELGNEGFGWLRTGNYMPGDDDCFVHQQMIRSMGLRPGDRVVGTVGPGRGNAKYPPLVKVSTINGFAPEGAKSRPRFRDLTPVFPNEPLTMENGKDSITGRAIDLVSPIGKGQRGLIVSPPKAGKTTVLKKICQSIAANNPEVHLFCLLVDERPEEVTDMERSIKGDVVASTFDMPADNHTRVSELVIEHAKRLVEMGEDVVVVLDSITRLARAYNLATPASGRILSGGVDSAALYPPKKFLGAARNIENGGSLTIIASALVDTGSKMDEVIFEEFKGTGNMELKLDRDLADRRIFPAIDPVSSGTRNEDLLIPAEYQPFVWGIRRVLTNMNNTERAANALVKGLKGTNDNREFLIKSAKKAQQTDYVS